MSKVPMNKTRMYRISFFNQNTIYEVYAKHICHDAFFGFVELEDLVFGSTGLVVDPSEERLKTEFAGVKKTYIPMHNVLRIDEVEKEGVAKIRELNGKGSNVAHFPVPVYTPGNSTPPPAGA